MRVGIVGAGNVATHLCQAIVGAGHSIVAVASRAGESAVQLAQKIGAQYYAKASDFPVNLDFILIAANDNAVREISDSLPVSDAIVAHTSGSIPLNDLSKHPSRAVIYPFQTFSKGIDVNIKEVPFFIETSDFQTNIKVRDFLGTFTSNIFEADSAKRAQLHIAGVLTSNFSIYLLDIAKGILEKNGMSLDVVRPLVNASIKKAFEAGPHESLTGPARRGDVEVVKKQSDAIDNPLHKEIYDAVSKSILHDFSKLE